MHGIADTPGPVQPQKHARGRRPQNAPGMNQTETAYSQHLETRRLAGDIWQWWFEPISFRLAPNTFYRPDFIVMLAGGELQVHEVKAGEKATLKSGIVREKARMEDDAAVKLKVSARLYDCFTHFVAWKSQDTGEWNLVAKN